MQLGIRVGVEIYMGGGGKGWGEGERFFPHLAAV